MPAQGGEKLLRIALFSNTLRITSKYRVVQTLMERRQSLAGTLRSTRKRGVVPVYISLAWFMFSLALSVEDAFGRLGDNQTAHNLALGLLLAWLPCFLIATIVDRNPVGADRVRGKLNEFLEVSEFRASPQILVAGLVRHVLGRESLAINISLCPSCKQCRPNIVKRREQAPNSTCLYTRNE